MVSGTRSSLEIDVRWTAIAYMYPSSLGEAAQAMPAFSQKIVAFQDGMKPLSKVNRSCGAEALEALVAMSTLEHPRIHTALFFCFPNEALVHDVWPSSLLTSVNFQRPCLRERHHPRRSSSSSPLL